MSQTNIHTHKHTNKQRIPRMSRDPIGSNKLFKSFSLNCNRTVYVSVACFCLKTVEKMSSYLVWFIESWILFGSPSTSYFSLTQLSNSGRESTCLEHKGQERFGLYCSQKSFLMLQTVLDLRLKSMPIFALLKSGLLR